MTMTAPSVMLEKLPCQPSGQTPQSPSQSSSSSDREPEHAVRGDTTAQATDISDLCRPDVGTTASTVKTESSRDCMMCKHKDEAMLAAEKRYSDLQTEMESVKVDATALEEAQDYADEAKLIIAQLHAIIRDLEEELAQADRDVHRAYERADTQRYDAISSLHAKTLNNLDFCSQGCQLRSDCARAR